MIVEHKEEVREGWCMNVKFIPILYNGVLHTSALTYREVEQLEEFKAKLMTKNNGEMPMFEDMSSTTLGLCEITQEDHVHTARVWFEWERSVWKAE